MHFDRSGMRAVKRSARANLPRVVLALAIGAFLAACGGEDGGTAAAPPSTAPNPGGSPSQGGQPPTQNAAPTIAGTPQSSVMLGTLFRFQPIAADPDDGQLTFSVEGLPGWATFSSTTGELQGTPRQQDIGSHDGIRITVSDGEATATLGPFSIDVVGTALGSATLSWEPPMQRTDGSPLTNLTGYKIYWGTVAGSYSNSVLISNPGVTSYVIDQLTPARWYFVATAVDAAGAESAFSNLASKLIQ